jgi:hypothetical protein
MNLFDKAKKFAQLINANDKKYNFSKSIALADKFDEKFNKISQSLNSTEPSRKALVKLLTDQWTADQANFPIEARNLYSSLRYPQGELSYEDLANTATKIYQVLTKSKNQNTINFATKNLMPFIDSLKAQMTKQPMVPMPQEEPAVRVPELKVTPSKYPSIPKDIQTKLNQILVPSGDIFPLTKIDGILGPETQKALDAFKTKYNFENLPLPQLIKRIREHEIPTT